MAVQLSPSDLCCLNLQQALDGIAGENDPAGIREELGFIDALRSPGNTRGLIEIADKAFPAKSNPQTGQGSRPRVEIKYLKPVNQSGSVNTARAGLCGDQDNSADPYDYMDFTIANTRAWGKDFSKDDFNALCEAPNERLAVEVKHVAWDILRAMNTQCITQAHALMGNYVNAAFDPSIGATAKTVNLLNPDGYVNPAAMTAVSSQFRKMHTNTPPIVVGGEILNIWRDTRLMAGIGSNARGANQNPGAVRAGIDAFIDYNVDTVVQGIETDTDSHGLSWTPGALRLLERYEYVDYKQEIGKEDYTETTINIEGWTFDFSLNYDKCTHTWQFELSKMFDLWAIPDAAYTQGASNIWRFNRRLHWKFGCGAFVCADYGL